MITRYLTVDDTWSNGEIRDLALSMRSIHTDDVSFLTAPFGSYDTSADGQSIVRLAPAKTKALFSAVSRTTTSSATWRSIRRRSSATRRRSTRPGTDGVPDAVPPCEPGTFPQRNPGFPDSLTSHAGRD